MVAESVPEWHCGTLRRIMRRTGVGIDTDRRAMPAAVQRNAHVFDRVADAADEEVAPQRAGEARLRAGAGFVENVVRAFKIQSCR